MGRAKDQALTAAFCGPASWADMAGSLGSDGAAQDATRPIRGTRKRGRPEESLSLTVFFIFVPIASMWTDADHAIVERFDGADLIETARLWKPDSSCGGNASGSLDEDAGHIMSASRVGRTDPRPAPPAGPSCLPPTEAQRTSFLPDGPSICNATGLGPRASVSSPQDTFRPDVLFGSAATDVDWFWWEWRESAR